MSERVDCPYCGTQLDLTSQDDVSKQYVRCTNCNGVFEYMPGFGTFSMPDRGAEYLSQTRTSRRVYPDGLSSTNQSDAAVSNSCGGCCVLLIILMAFLITGFQLLFIP